MADVFGKRSLRQIRIGAVDPGVAERVTARAGGPPHLQRERVMPRRRHRQRQRDLLQTGAGSNPDGPAGDFAVARGEDQFENRLFRGKIRAIQLKLRRFPRQGKGQ